MARVGVEDDILHAAAEKTGRHLIATLEVALENELAAMHDKDGVDVRARSRKPIGHLAERGRVNELVVVAGGDGPAIGSRGCRGEAFDRMGAEGGERCASKNQGE